MIELYLSKVTENSESEQAGKYYARVSYKPLVTSWRRMWSWLGPTRPRLRLLQPREHLIRGLRTTTSTTTAEPRMVAVTTEATLAVTTEAVATWDRIDGWCVSENKRRGCAYLDTPSSCFNFVVPITYAGREPWWVHDNDWCPCCKDT